MNEIVVKNDVKIEDMIFEVRGKQLMLDSNVATLFGYQTKDLNRNVNKVQNKKMKSIQSKNKKVSKIRNSNRKRK